jgi:hypothetical protein
MKTETKVYLLDFYNYDLDCDEISKYWDDKKFMDEAEKQGNVYNLSGFQDAYNEGDINGENSYIRII